MTCRDDKSDKPKNGGYSKLVSAVFGFTGILVGLIVGVMVEELRQLTERAADDRTRITVLETHIAEINKIRRKLEYYQLQERLNKEGAPIPKKVGETELTIPPE